MVSSWRLGIRCDNIRIAEEKISEYSFQLPVFAVAREADTTLFTFKLHDVFIHARTRKSLRYGLSDQMWLDFDQNQILFFKKTMEMPKA